MNRTMQNIANQSGASIIDALVSLFIFSIGALGLAALQTTAIIQSDDSKQRSLATWKGQELVDRMLSTRTFSDSDGLIAEYAAIIGENEDGIKAFGVDNNTFNCAVEPDTNCSEENCNTNELIAYDVNDVLCNDDSGLRGTADGISGAFGLSDMDIAMRASGNYYELYIAWQSRTANRDYSGDDDGADLNGLDGTIATNLCGNSIDLDVRVDAICIRFQ